MRHRYLAGIDDPEDTPKSGSVRSVPLSDPAAVILDRVSRREEFTRKSDLVFPAAKGQHSDASVLRKAYNTGRDVVIAREAESDDDG